MRVYTAFLSPIGAEPSDYVRDDWSSVARSHNEKMLGQPLNVITNDSPGYRPMLDAASSTLGDSWPFRTLASYLAVREFGEADGPQDELFVWLDADMIVNPLIQDRSWLQRRGTLVANPEEHLMTVHERYKRDFAMRAIGMAKADWTQILTSLFILERSHVVALLNALHAGGFDLFTRAAWERIAATYDRAAFPDSYFYSDQAFELAYHLAGLKPESVWDLASWVSYHSPFDDKPLIHFDGNNKARLTGWLARTKGCIGQSSAPE